jgi:hypothetical protein
VEIRDAMIDTRVSFGLSEPERELVERAERHLLRAGPTDPTSTFTSPASTVERQRQR